MEKTTRKKIWLGIITFMATLLFFIAIFLAGRKENLFERTFILSTIFSDVNGLKNGNYVYYAGVRGGIVKKITFVNDSMIKVDMRMDKRLQQLIKKDAKVYISTQGLVGDKILQIKPSHHDTTAVKNNDTLAAMNPYDMHEVIEKLMATNEHVELISKNLAELSNRINKPYKGLLSGLTNDSTMAGYFKDLLFSFRATGEHLSSLSARLENITQHTDINSGVLGALLQDSLLKKEVSRTIHNLDSISDYSLKIATNLNRSVEHPDTKSALHVLMRDSVFARDLKEGVNNFKKSTAKLDKDMEALQHNFLFRNYFRKHKVYPAK